MSNTENRDGRPPMPNLLSMIFDSIKQPTSRSRLLDAGERLEKARAAYDKVLGLQPTTFDLVASAVAEVESAEAQLAIAFLESIKGARGFRKLLPLAEEELRRLRAEGSTDAASAHASGSWVVMTPEQEQRLLFDALKGCAESTPERMSVDEWRRLEELGQKLGEAVPPRPAAPGVERAVDAARGAVRAATEGADGAAPQVLPRAADSTKE